MRTGQIWERPSNRKACSVVLSPTHGSSGLQGVTLAEQLWELKEEICRKPISSIPLRARRLTAILECWRIRRKSRPISCGSRSNWGQVMLRPLWVKSCTDACYVTMLLISRASQCLKWTSLHLECCIDRFLVERIVKKKKVLYIPCDFSQTDFIKDSAVCDRPRRYRWALSRQCMAMRSVVPVLTIMIC